MAEARERYTLVAILHVIMSFAPPTVFVLPTAVMPSSSTLSLQILVVSPSSSRPYDSFTTELSLGYSDF